MAISACQSRQKRSSPVRQWAVYYAFSAKKKLEYSLLKLGDTRITARFTKEMRYLIRSKTRSMSGGGFVLFAIDRYPLKNLDCKKTSLLLAEGLARSLKLPLVTARYRYVLRNGTEVQTTPVIQSGKRYLNTGTDVLSIDDSIYDGVSLKRTIQVLKTARSILHFAIVRGKNKSAEISLNNLAFKRKGPGVLPGIIRQKGYFFTSQMLKTIEALSRSEKKELLHA